MAVLMIAPWLVVAGLLTFIGLGYHLKPSIAASSASPYSVVGNPGPWGQLEYRPIRIDLPDEFVFVPPSNQPPVRWVFHAMNKDQSIEFLKTCGITSTQLELIQKANWKVDGQNAVVEPGDEFILTLSADVREKIYSTLVEFDENSRQIDPVWFRTGQVDEQLKDCGLAPKSVELLKSLLYAQGPSMMLFADFEPALRKLPSDKERHLFMNAVSRKRTLLAGLYINANSDMESIVNYWGVGGRKMNVSPLLRALHHEGEARVNIVCLLPNFPSDHIYTHAFSNPVDGSGPKEDCFWSAMNFFNDVPDNRVNDMNFLRDLLKSDYASITQPTQLGDVVFLATAKDAVIHAAAYIADDIVFTKNGESYTQPWIFMHMQDMLDTYAVKHPHSGPLKVLCYRKKSLF
jgi:hypothetical protein